MLSPPPRPSTQRKDTVKQQSQWPGPRELQAWLSPPPPSSHSPKPAPQTNTRARAASPTYSSTSDETSYLDDRLASMGYPPFHGIPPGAQTTGTSGNLTYSTAHRAAYKALGGAVPSPRLTHVQPRSPSSLAVGGLQQQRPAVSGGDSWSSSDSNEGHSNARQKAEEKWSGPAIDAARGHWGGSFSPARAVSGQQSYSRGVVSSSSSSESDAQTARGRTQVKGSSSKGHSHTTATTRPPPPCPKPALKISLSWSAHSPASAARSPSLARSPVPQSHLTSNRHDKRVTSSPRTQHRSPASASTHNRRASASPRMQRRRQPAWHGGSSSSSSDVNADNEGTAHSYGRVSPRQASRPSAIELRVTMPQPSSSLPSHLRTRDPPTKIKLRVPEPPSPARSRTASLAWSSSEEDKEGGGDSTLHAQQRQRPSPSRSEAQSKTHSSRGHVGEGAGREAESRVRGKAPAHSMHSVHSPPALQANHIRSRFSPTADSGTSGALAGLSDVSEQSGSEGNSAWQRVGGDKDVCLFVLSNHLARFLSSCHTYPIDHTSQCTSHTFSLPH